MKLRKDGKVDQRTVKYVTVQWRDNNNPDPSRRFNEANYDSSIVQELVDGLLSRGFTDIYVDDKLITEHQIIHIK